ncbi:MAG: D-alanyl-lipoteichoic acid acyltransferase DltB (MBOAT superfamily) [Polaribacter sp.]|jgi:D-alanyl-lipoteichoic acid acyltransferase DltB (MBOAT superfamily)
MLFNSIDFAIFLPIVFLLYWFVVNKNLKFQNLLIVLASYTFYGWWDWRFLSLILFSTVIDYLIGRRLLVEGDTSKRKLLLWISIAVNLGFLGFFKYYNFFLDNFLTAFSFFGTDIKANSLNIILPVGISFYTFQTLSYTIDVYKRKLEPTKDFIAFSAFVSFFPQLVAGPIERATNLLPQFYKKRTFKYDKAVDGLRQILWGLFKKIVIADNSAQIANEIFNNSADYSGSTLVLGAIFFTFQIYGDFSGYSDIAIGTSRLFGFNLKQNFAFPYFSRDIAEFWRRWHISLSTWFRDYLYIPLGGSRGGTWMKVRNTFVIFIVSGFWHGANWTFIVWGALNALYFLPLLLLNKNRTNTDTVAKGKWFPSVKELFQIGTTFSLTLLAWVFFRAENIGHALSYLSTIFSYSIFDFPEINTSRTFTLQVLMMIVLFLFIEWNGRTSQYALEKIGFRWNKYYRLLLYFSITLLIFMFLGKEQQFIYFQF